MDQDPPLGAAGVVQSVGDGECDSDDTAVVGADDPARESQRPGFPDRDLVRLELDQNVADFVLITALLVVYMRIFIPM